STMQFQKAKQPAKANWILGHTDTVINFTSAIISEERGRHSGLQTSTGKEPDTTRLLVSCF
ncbi:MAG TPA: hypothetical protein VF141_13560, partial [Chryseolinea sp.]